MTQPHFCFHSRICTLDRLNPTDLVSYFGGLKRRNATLTRYTLL